MKTEQETNGRVPIDALYAVENENRNYRKNRIEGVFFVTGIVAAMLHSVLWWPLGMRMPSAAAFALWVISLAIYSEMYLCVTGSGISGAFSRIKNERRLMRCVVLLLLPSFLRSLRTIAIVSLAR